MGTTAAETSTSGAAASDGATSGETTNSTSNSTTSVNINSVPLFSGIAAGGSATTESTSAGADGGTTPSMTLQEQHFFPQMFQQRQQQVQQQRQDGQPTATNSARVHTTTTATGGGRTVRLNIGGGNFMTINQQRQPVGSGSATAAATTNSSSRIPQLRIRHPGRLPTTIRATQASSSSSPMRPNGVAMTNNSTGVTVTHHQSPFNNALHVVQLNPLVPQPLPFTNNNESSSSQGNGDNEGDDDDEAMSHFKCAICYEFMKEPSGCGNTDCSSRFCYSCLHRVASGVDSSNSNSANSAAAARCPTCRKSFPEGGGIVRDENLAIEIFNAPTIKCRYYPQCKEQLRLPLIADHEKQCLHVPLKCRYAPYGCKWTGKRGELSQHEQNTCSLAKVSVLVEQVRDIRANYNHRINMIQQQTVGAIRMNNVHHQNLHRDQLQSTSNVIELFYYCYLVMCLTPHFLSSKKERYVAYYRTNNGRAAVFNFMTLLPTFITSFMVTISGYKRFISFLENDNVHDENTTTADLVVVAEDLALTLWCVDLNMCVSGHAEQNHFGWPHNMLRSSLYKLFSRLFQIFSLPMTALDYPRSC